MISKEKLLAIKELTADDIIKMNDKQLEDYCKALDAFIDSFPVHESKLKSAFEAEDHDSFSEILLNIWYALAKIQAKGLALNCRKLINEVETANHEIVEAHLTYLLTAISAFSIDIQMSQHNDVDLNKSDTKTVPHISEGESMVERRQKIILAVDDVSFLLTALKATLFNTEYKFTGVTSGMAALRYIESHKPDLFILDIEMPEMNGYELAAKIREKGQTAPIVFLTGNATKEYVQKAVLVGAADFIVKPINKENVLEKIKKYIG